MYDLLQRSDTFFPEIPRTGTWEVTCHWNIEVLDGDNRGSDLFTRWVKYMKKSKESKYQYEFYKYEDLRQISDNDLHRGLGESYSGLY